MLHYSFAGHASSSVGVVDVVNGVGIAIFIGQAGGTCAVVNENAVLLVCHLAYRQSGRGIYSIDDDIDLLPVEPFAGLVGGDIRLVLVIGRD